MSRVFFAPTAKALVPTQLLGEAVDEVMRDCTSSIGSKSQARPATMQGRCKASASTVTTVMCAMNLWLRKEEARCCS